MYSIATAADLMGLCQETIRDWERSYDLVAPRRTAGGQTRYREEDLRSLAAMASLVEVGWQPAEAAVEAKGRAQRATGSPPAAPMREGNPDDLTTTFVAAVVRLDAPCLVEVLDAAWGCYGPDGVADGWLMPALAALGEAHERGELSAAHTQVAVDLTSGRLLADLDDALRGLPPGAPPVIVGVGCGVSHDLGALAFAGLLARAGVPSSFLGGGVPDADWESLARGARARHVVLTVPRPQDAVRSARLAERLMGAVQGLTVHVGGRYQHLLTPPVRTLGHHLGTAADALALSLAFDRLPQAKTQADGAMVAEADGNRTRQTEMLGFTGFEDRGDHQEPRRLHRAG